MATITPRWEWRTFGPRLGRAEVVFAGLDQKDVQESDEIYLLTETGSNVKIRNELLDIKALQKVNNAGLEQWMPVMKAGFPLPAATVGEVFKAMNVPAPPVNRGEYTLEQFLNELVKPHPAVTPVEVHKRRVRYTVGGCMAELSEVTAGGKKTKTIAVESEDAGAVVAAVRSLGLENYANTNYTLGLADLVSSRLPRFGVIDVGTNSVKFHIAELAEDNTWRAVVDRAELTRLGEGLEKSGVISQAATERTAQAIADMVAEARRNRCVAIAAVGTAGLRIARNAGEVIDAIRSQAGVSIEVISGEEEGLLAYLAVRAGLPFNEGALVVFDTGGGSSQFTFGQGDRVLERFSVDVGAVRYTERFGLSGVVPPHILAEAMGAISADLTRIDGRPKPDNLAAMGGAVTNLTAVSYGMAKYDPDVIQGTILHRSEIERQIEMYRSTPLEARREIIGLQPKRADVILAGACIVRTIMDKLGKDSLTVSDRGLRHGLLVERFRE
jgi:exopolyphosphatase/guanosine-5'-triphosphate,3'-diphosphate pyrophosphatase